MSNFIVKKAREMRDKLRSSGRTKITDRSKGKEKLCIILAGYKKDLWSEVFGRIKRFSDDDIDYCILSSGIYVKELEDIAEENGWSYISTKRNNVALIQNIAINHFSNAKYIYKLDEDIFLCQGYFSDLYNAYIEGEMSSHYHVGIVAPLLPLNGFCYIHFLKKVGKLEEFEKKFGLAKHGSNVDDKVMVSPEIAKYLWNLSYEIDNLADRFSSNGLELIPCHCRFSIGAILFKREFWQGMGRFKVGTGNALGDDEVQMCSYAMTNSKSLIVSGNTLAGHYSFGPQNKVMNKAYQENNMLKRLF